MSQDHLELRKTRDFGEKLNVTFEFLKRAFKPLMTALIYIAGPAILLSAAGYVMYMDDISNLFTNIQTNAERFGLEFLTNVGIYIILFLIAYMLLNLTVLNYLKLYLEKRTFDISPSEVWEKVKDGLFNYFLAYFLLILLFVVVAIISGLLIGLFAGNFFFTFLIIFTLFFALFYFFVSVSLFSNILVIENRSAAEIGTIISRCFYLIKGKWWSTFGILFVAGIIVSMAGGILQAPITFGQLFTMLGDIENMEEPPMPTYATWQLVYLGIVQAIQQLLSVISLLAISFQYFNLVEMKEASGLVDRIASIDSEERKETSSQSGDKEDDEHY